MNRIRAAILFAPLALSLVSSPTADAEPEWKYPWPNSTSHYNVGGNGYDCGTTHQQAGPAPWSSPGGWDIYALDFGVPLEHSVASAAGGIVKHVEPNDTGALGRYVIVYHTGFYTVYAHLLETSVAIADRVRGGKKVGESGQSGNASGPHLHFQAGVEQPDGVHARKPEVMTGIREDNMRYKGWDQLGDYGLCGGESYSTTRRWHSAAPLSDVFLYDNLGAWQNRFSEGNGDFVTGESSTTLCCWDVHAGKFNGDEDSDLFFYFPGTTVNQWEVWKRNPSQPTGWNVVDGDTQGEPTFITGAEAFTTELNGDGLTDLILYDKDFSATEAKIQTWLSDGSGSWSLGMTEVWTGGNGWDLVTGSFTNDTISDIVQYDRDGLDWRMRSGDGAGGFDTIGNGSFTFCCREMLPGYFDHDRRTDLYRYYPEGTGWSVQSPGGGSFTELGSGFWSGDVDQTVVGHFNQGLTSDLLRYNSSGGGYAVKLANGSGGWANVGGSFSTGKQIHTASLGQDERTDIILYDPSSGTVGVRFSANAGQWSGEICDGGCSWPAGLEHIVPAYLDGDANGAQI